MFLKSIISSMFLILWKCFDTVSVKMIGLQFNTQLSIWNILFSYKAYERGSTSISSALWCHHGPNFFPSSCSSVHLIFYPPFCIRWQCACWSSKHHYEIPSSQVGRNQDETLKSQLIRPTIIQSLGRDTLPTLLLARKKGENGYWASN